MFLQDLRVKQHYHSKISYSDAKSKKKTALGFEITALTYVNLADHNSLERVFTQLLITI